MPCSKKDYVAIAKIISGEREFTAQPSRCDRPLNDGELCNLLETKRGLIARELARYFASSNPGFDRARFLAACGIAD